MAKAKGWRELPIGGMIEEAGNAAELNTGAWRAFRPIVNKDKCTNCLQCWMFCPDMSVEVQDNKMLGFDYYHCKGCGICASTCPVEAITMLTEAEAAKADSKVASKAEEEVK
jgi:pyruvate ferredoxin oxidoreductase delta subunit